MINVKDFKFELFGLKEPIKTEANVTKRVKYTSVSFVYNGQEALLKMSGLFRSFTNVKDWKVSYSIRMTADETNEDFLLALKRRIRVQVALQIYDINMEDIKLIK